MVALETPNRTATAPQTTTRTITGGALACEALLACGATTLFGYPGGVTLPFYDAMRDHVIRHILVRHEQNAAFMAAAARHAIDSVNFSLLLRDATLLITLCRLARPRDENRMISVAAG